MKQSTILAVEDEVETLDIISARLARAGYNVVTATDGLEAVKQFGRNRNDLGIVLLDLHMPGLNGIEAGRRMKRINPHIPIILTTGYHLALKSTNGNWKPCDILIKPFFNRVPAQHYRFTFAGVIHPYTQKTKHTPVAHLRATFLLKTGKEKAPPRRRRGFRK